MPNEKKANNAAVRHLGVKTTAAKEFIAVAHELAVLMDAKQQDYGPDNINDFGVTGVVVRMNDKVRRIRYLLKKNRLAKNEPFIDSFKDTANYAIIAILLLRNKWPKTENETQP